MKKSIVKLLTVLLTFTCIPVNTMNVLAEEHGGGRNWF